VFFDDGDALPLAALLLSHVHGGQKQRRPMLV
jgi:hypothetical protein